MKYSMLPVSLFVLSNILCHWSVKNAKSFDGELQSLEDFNQYIRSVRKLYNRPKIAPDRMDGLSINTFNYSPNPTSNENMNRAGFEVAGNPFIPVSRQRHRTSPLLEFASPAACVPEKTVVPVPLPRAEDGRSLSVFPSCTRLERCGGCCSHPLLSCQPTREETVSLQVLVVDNRDFSDRCLDLFYLSA